ncbi:CCR4-NOT transcription complex subunit 1 isoform X5 [Paramuricea clavata]|uniref:CCR4-NOT transcription complex subunit 1 isoform X5 n=1 Tax=Paramuricea clavata TaxID=317549 RepID=A0A6S7GKM9_PARCT|nr:CCR4-NOT transcription complex subunit 1 isoform X5 [Paramuricea clavata]
MAIRFVDATYLALSQISFLVTDLSKKNYKSSMAQIQNLVEQHGAEAERHYLRSLFSSIDFSAESKGTGKDFHQVQLLSQECQTLICKTNFISIVCYAIENQEQHQKSLKPSSHLLPQISKVLKFSRVQEVVFGLGLMKSSNEELRNFAGMFVKQKLPDLLRSYIDSDVGGVPEGGLTDVAIEVLHLLLTYLLYTPQKDVGIGEHQKQAFLDTLRKDFPSERVPVVLAPLLYQGVHDMPLSRFNVESSPVPKLMMEDDLSKLMHEIGYSCCASVQECKETLGQSSKANITPMCIAKVLGMMARTVSGLGESMPLQTSVNIVTPIELGKPEEPSTGPNTWNVEMFVTTVKEMIPELNWTEVISCLDHPGFLISTVEALRLIVTACHKGLQDIFPIEILYHAWSNTEGQLSWIQQALINPDVFCFADYPCHTVIIDVLKSPPEDNNREILTWQSLSLVETLLRLAECGHYETVKALFDFPIKNCPDVLVLALLQTNPTWQTLKYDLASILIPIFLANHPNSLCVLHHVWHGQGQSSPSIRHLVIQAMADWYMNGDAGDLSRILDVAQDLKALSILLNGSTFSFVIDLAALASRREYLKLDKWLNDKLREHQEEFAVAVVDFLKRRCPHLVGIIPEQELPKSAQLPPETVNTMLSCLQAYSGHVSLELGEEIKQMISRHGPILKSRQPSVSVSMPSLSRQTSRDPGLPGQMDSLAGLNLSSGTIPPTPTTPSQLPTFPPHPLSTGGGLGALGLGPAIGQPPSKPISQIGAGLTPSGLTNTSGNPLLQQLQVGFSNENFHSLGVSSSAANFTSTKPLGSLSAFPPQPAPPVQTQQLAGNPRQQAEKLRQNTAGSDITAALPGVNQSFPGDVEAEANSYFQKIYNQPPNPTMTIDEVLEMLKKFKDSSSKKEKDVFLCMLRNLFEEYGHFHNYPNRELHTTACLFGGIIDQGLVTYMALGIALRYVLDALRKPYQSKMYLFGITALDRFRMRLKDYQHYCRHLASIPHFNEFPPHLIEFIEYGKQSVQPPLSSRSLQDSSSTNYFGKATSSVSDALPPSTGTAVTTTAPSSGADTAKQFSLSTGVSSNGSTRKEPSIANASNIDTLLGATEKSELAQPSESVQDKVHFIFNNISTNNLTQKGEELKEAVKSEFFPWLAQYLVMKRVSIEPNFHDLYIKFMETLEWKELFQMVLQETYRNIKVLLQSDKVPANFSDRSLLKNLGHWLGLMTLAQNKPVLMREMLYVVPFVAKVMEGCAKSRIFKPPNPWVMAVMGVLVELHQVPDLKLNLKFEVEVLCHTLSIDMKEEITPTTLLKDPEKLNQIKHQLSSPDKDRHAGPSVLSQAPPTTPPPPQYSYQEINVASLAGLAGLIKINPQIALFQQQPQLRQYVRPAIDRAVQELIHPVVERSIKICLTTAEMIVKKDFALDPDESRMRAAAYSMVRFMTAGMALITCREPLNISINNNLRSTLMAALRGATPQQKEAIESAAQIVSEENTELACTFIQKTAVEKALPEMDKRLASEFELRRLARSEGRRYCDPVVLTYQAERMPEQIRLKVGGVTPNQTAVFEEFAKTIPGFTTPTPGESLSTPASFTNNRSIFEQNLHASEPAILPEDIAQILGKCTAEIEQHLHAMNLSQSSPHGLAIVGLLDVLVTARTSRDSVSLARVVHKAVKGLLEGLNPIPSDTELALRYRDCHLVVLRSLQDPRACGPHWTGKHVTKFVCECPPDVKFNVDVIDILIRSRLINMREFDIHLAQCIENELNVSAIHFAVQLTKLYLIDEHSNHVSQGELYQTLEALSRIANSRSGIGDGLSSILEVIRGGGMNSANEFPQRFNDLDKGSSGQAGLSLGLSGLRFEDPPGLHDKVEFLLREWVRLYHQPAAGKESEKAFSTFVAMLHQHGILKTDDLITRFFRISTELCVENTYRALIEHSSNRSHARAKCFSTLDAYCRLIALLVRHSGDASNSVTKINLLTRVLGTVVQVLLQDHELRKTDFHQLAYHRIFIILLLELNQPEPVLEAINYQVLQTFSTIFHALRPSRAPGFAYAWLELISHRMFMSKLLLNTPQQKGWVLFQQLLIDLFKFLAPFLRNAELNKPTHLLYKGTLRVLLVLLHDFPEFLCDYHFSFCDVIPPNCIQMRNLILSAFPRNMRLPDPFTPNLKVM